MHDHQLRPSSRRASGLGAARKGVAHWWTQRVTAVALIPLTLWLTASVIALGDDDYQSLIGWLKTPHVTTVMPLLLIALFYHMALGLQVVIEDYVHREWLKAALLAGTYLSCFALACMGIVATLRIAFSA
jgi:succinate dehydrogenase / fumarate reductase membrane anchor subunit